MKINWVEVKRGDTFMLKKCEFFDFTLLVGKTGMGKSEILNAINFFRVFLGAGQDRNQRLMETVIRNYIDCSVRIAFSIQSCQYEYEVSLAKESQSSVTPEDFCQEEFMNARYVVSMEKLEQNGTQLFYRDETTARFLSYHQLPKITASMSLFTVFSQEPVCEQIIRHFQKIHFIRDDMRDRAAVLTGYDILRDYMNNDKPVAGPARYLPKLALIYEYDTETFDEIKTMYMGVFEDVTDMRYEYNDRDQFVLKICHSDGNWIDQFDISAGMLKTLHLIVLMKTSREGSVFLIDEIENSLGMNCLDVVVEELSFSKTIQCVITSHHPYVINNISPEKWIVVSRNGDEICTRSAEDLGIGDTNLSPFHQLINAFHFEEA